MPTKDLSAELELIEHWKREAESNKRADSEYFKGVCRTYELCADQLEAVLGDTNQKPIDFGDALPDLLKKQAE